MAKLNLRTVRALDPLFWTRTVLALLWRALQRLWGRDVMLYVGGASFFSLLAVFPALSLLLGVYTLLLTPDEAARQADAFAYLMPPGARDLITSELSRLAHAPMTVTSTQSLVALVIGAYASHRGFKALLAGLAFIHDEEDTRGFLRFNVMALLVLAAAFASLIALTLLFLGLRLVASTLNLKPLAGAPWIYSEWTWVSLGLWVGLSLIYRYAMSAKPVGWRASISGGAAAAAMFVGASWASAFYVEQVAQLGATYGSLAAVVVFLIWLSWNVNAVFFGGGLATEVQVLLHEHPDLGPGGFKRASRPGS
jgi:membrane protein